MNKRKKRWTNDEELVIISMRADKKSIKEIAAVLKRSEEAVKVRCHKLINECKIQKTTRRKVNLSDIAKCASENMGNITKGFKEYSEKHNIPYDTIIHAYYKKDKSGIRAKDIIKHNIIMFGRSGILINGKNSNEIPNKNSLWHSIKGWLLSHLLS